MLEISAAIITNGSEILCFQKGVSKRDYLSFKFEFPGGKLEPGEDPLQALVRELSEELDLDIADLPTVPFKDMVHEYPDFSVLLHYFMICSKEPRFTLREHVAAKWIPIEALTDLDWADADSEMARMIRDEGVPSPSAGEPRWIRILNP